MATDRNLTLALRIKADVKAAQAALKETQNEVRGLSRETEKANAASAASTKATKDQTKAVQDLGAAQKSSAETEEQARARIAAVVAQSRKATDAAQRRAAVEQSASSSIAKSTESEIAQHRALAAAQTRAMQAATNRRAPLRQLQAILAKNKLTTSEVAKAEALLDATQASGVITSAELKKSFETLAAVKIVDTKITNKNARANVKDAAARKLNTRATAELGTALSEIAAGNFGRLRRTGAALANQTGLLAKLFSAEGLAILGVAGAVIGLAVAYVKGLSEQEKLNAQIKTTGDYAGQTASSVDAMANSIAASSGGIRDAREALSQLISSGKFTADQLQKIGTAAVNMEDTTGQAIDTTVKQFERLQESPVRASAALNRQYHYLTASVYAQIQALKQQGDTEAAAKLATDTYANAINKRSDELRKHLGSLQRFMQGFKRDLQTIEDALLSIGKSDIGTQIDDNLKQQLDLRQKIHSLEIKGYSDDHPLPYGITLGKYKQQLQDLIDGYNKLNDQRKKNAQAAKQASQAAQTQQKGIEGLSYVTAQENKYADAAAKYQQRLDKINKNFDAAIKAMPQKVAELNARRGKLLREVVDQYAKSLPSSDRSTGNGNGGGARSAAQREAEAQAKAAAAAQQGLIQSLVQMQAQLDPAAAAWAKYNKAVSQANTQAATAKTAHNADVAAIDGEKNAVIALAAQQRDAALASIQHANAVKSLQNLQQQVQSIEADASRQSQQVQAEQQAGLISEYTARKRLLGIRQREAAQLQALVPVLRKAAQASGDPKAIQGVKDLEAEIGRLKIQANQLKTAFESGLTQGLEGALEGLATGALTVAGAFRELAQTVIRSLAQVAARALAAKAIGALSSLFGDGDKTKDVGAGAAKLSLAGGVLSGASLLLGTNAQKLQAAADTLLIANSVGVAAGFASGGYTGPGGKYDVAGVVHAGEVVQRSEVVRQPGALPFLIDFNRRGMAALHDAAASLVGYADGGLVAPLRDVPTPRVPSMPRPRLAATAGNDGKSGPAVSFHNVNVVDPDLVSSYLRGAGGKDDVINIIKDNRSTLRQVLS